MATFGVTSILGSSNNINKGQAMVLQVTAPANGTVTSMSAYLNGQNGTSTTLTLFIYADNGSNVPGTLLASSPGQAIGNVAATWWTDTISLAITNGTIYWLAAGIANAGSSAVVAKWGSQTGFRLGQNVAYNSSPATGYSLIGNNFGMSIYATYSPPLASQQGALMALPCVR